MWRLVLSAMMWLAFAVAPGHTQFGIFQTTLVNPSRSLLNPGFIGSFEFLNYFKTCGSQQAGTYAYPGILDANNYPTSSPSTSISSTCNIPTEYTGNWIVDWTGEAGNGTTAALQISVGTAFTVISDPGSCVKGATTANLNLSGTACTVTFKFATSTPGFTFIFLSGGAFNGTLNNLRLYRSDQAALIAAGGVYNPDYVSVAWTALAPKVGRFLNWTAAASNMNSQWAYRTPITAFTFGNGYWPSGAWAGTVSGTNTYTVGNSSDCTANQNGCSASAYTDGELITVHFTNANTSSTPTINRNSLGAKTIVDQFGSTLANGAIAANSNGQLMYDATLGQFMWRPDGLAAGVPFETVVAFCNLIVIDCWTQFPAHFLASSVTSLVAYISANLSSTLSAYFEYSNEVWNFANFDTNWAQQIGAKIGPNASPDLLRNIFFTYALKVCTLMPVASSAWGARSAAQFLPVMAWQGAGDVSTNTMYRFGGSDVNGVSYNGSTVTCNSSPTPHSLTKVGSYANYLSGAQIANSDSNYTNPISAPALAAADSFAAGGGGIATAMTWLDGDLRNGTGDNSGQDLAGIGNYYTNWSTAATAYSWNIVLYEGGLEALGPSSAVCTTQGISSTYCCPASCFASAGGKIQNTLDYYKTTSTLSRQLVTDLYNNFLAHQTRALYPAWFQIGPGADQWSLINGDIYTPTYYQSYTAIQQFN